MHPLITIITLEGMSDADLYALFDALWRALIQSDYGTADRRNILASMENIETVLRRRHARELQPERPLVRR